MKLITYMMQYLTSILSPGTSKSQDYESLEARIEDLERRTANVEASLSEIALCIQQLAGSLASVITQVSSRKDPLDDLLSGPGSDDDGSGYLH